jgi:hypothetical protein
MSTILERYNAYKASKGMSETAATVTAKQSYNVRSGGVSASEQSTINKIREQQRQTKLDNQRQSEKFWAITTAKKTDVPKILLNQPKGANTRTGNLAEYIKQEGYDINNMPQDWDRPQKQTELREFSKTNQSWHQELGFDPRFSKPETREETTAKRMGFGGGGGAANLGLMSNAGYETITEEQPANFAEWVFGRINTPIQEPQTITKEPEIIEVTPEPIVKHSVKHQLEPVNKSLIAVGAVIGLAALFVIWRMKK